MKSIAAQLDPRTATTGLWKPVTATELTQIEGGLFGISWDDVKKAAKFLASKAIEIVIHRR